LPKHCRIQKAIISHFRNISASKCLKNISIFLPIANVPKPNRKLSNFGVLNRLPAGDKNGMQKGAKKKYFYTRKKLRDIFSYPQQEFVRFKSRVYNWNKVIHIKAPSKAILT